MLERLRASSTATMQPGTSVTSASRLQGFQQLAAAVVNPVRLPDKSDDRIAIRRLVQDHLREARGEMRQQQQS